MATFSYEGNEYTLVDPDAWTTLEAIKLEAYSGRKPAEVLQDFAVMGPLGVHGMIWLSLRRAGVDVAWGDLELPFVDTLRSIKGEPVTEPPDPSTASTVAPKAVRRTPSARARSQKK